MTHELPIWLGSYRPIGRDVRAWGLPALQFTVTLAAILVALAYLQRLILVVLFGVTKITGRGDPKNLYKYQLPKLKDGNSHTFPMCLVQIPMYNEKDVYQCSIRSVCSFTWPSDRFIVQVLDDSNDPQSKELIEAECQKWANKGINIKYETRPDRKGYKAGNLAAGLKHSYVRDCQFVCIFDADFEPPPNFLERTIPFLAHNPELGFVMGAWGSTNADATLIARIQGVQLETMMGLTQPVASGVFRFANFFGTGGVWRLDALHDSGGWQSRGLTEDTDMALSAILRGWKSAFVDVVSYGEVPVAYKTFRTQTTRWGCGAVSLFKVHAADVVRSKVIGLGTKYYILGIMFAFMIYESIAGALFSCFVVPVALLVPQIHVPKILFAPVFLAYGLHVLAVSPKSFHMALPLCLFDNVKAVVRVNVLASTLLGLSSSEFVVTTRMASEKLGKSIWTKLVEHRSMFYLELAVGAYLLAAAWFGSSAYWFLRLYLSVQALAFFLCGLDISL